MRFPAQTDLDGLRAVSRDALDAYRAIGMGPNGWNTRDREAFARLAALLDDLDRRPPLMARIKVALRSAVRIRTAPS